MKNPTLATFGLIVVMTFGLGGLPPLPAADNTVIPTSAPAGTPTQAFITFKATLTATITSTVTATPTRRSTAAVTPTLGPVPTATWTPTLLPTATPVVEATPTAVPPTPNGTRASPEVNGAAGGSVATPNAIAALTGPSGARYNLTFDANSVGIETLRARPYPGGQIKITRVLSSGDTFTRVLFEYPSDGLRITGVMNIPNGAGPFPVIILNHGYFKPNEYKTGDGTFRAADYFARHGYLTLASDYRCYATSQCGPNPLYVGYAIDVLNLIGSLSSLPQADLQRVGIWGHSMGGGITIRVITITNQVKAAVLYGSLTADDEIHYCWLYNCRTPTARTPVARATRPPEYEMGFLEGIPTPAPSSPYGLERLHEIFLKSSPSRYLQYVTAPVMVHHGEVDDIVPIKWSVDYVDYLNALGKPARLYTYPDGGHVFSGWNWQLFTARALNFFNQQLNVRESPMTVEQRVLRQERGLWE